MSEQTSGPCREPRVLYIIRKRTFRPRAHMDIFVERHKPDTSDMRACHRHIHVCVSCLLKLLIHDLSFSRTWAKREHSKKQVHTEGGWAKNRYDARAQFLRLRELEDKGVNQTIYGQHLWMVPTGWHICLVKTSCWLRFGMFRHPARGLVFNSIVNDSRLLKAHVQTSKICILLLLNLLQIYYRLASATIYDRAECWSWAIGSYSCGPPAARSARTKSMGGCYHTVWSPSVSDLLKKTSSAMGRRHWTTSLLQVT